MSDRSLPLDDAPGSGFRKAFRRRWMLFRVLRIAEAPVLVLLSMGPYLFLNSVPGWARAALILLSWALIHLIRWHVVWRCPRCERRLHSSDVKTVEAYGDLVHDCGAELY